MKQYVVDAFTDKVFEGKPAAVCVMDEWLTDETMLGKNDLITYQASLRGGTLYCDYQWDRVKISGKTALYSTADINF